MLFAMPVFPALSGHRATHRGAAIARQFANLPELRINATSSRTFPAAQYSPAPAAWGDRRVPAFATHPSIILPRIPASA